MVAWYKRHNMGISAFVSGLCLEGMISCLAQGDIGFAFLEFILFALNLWIYTELREQHD